MTCTFMDAGRDNLKEDLVGLASFITGSARLLGTYFAFKLLVVLTLVGVPFVFDRSYFLYVILMDM